jgi:hypothetical protein
MTNNKNNKLLDPVFFEELDKLCSSYGLCFEHDYDESDQLIFYTGIINSGDDNGDYFEICTGGNENKVIEPIEAAEFNEIFKSYKHDDAEFNQFLKLFNAEADEDNKT